ncbi:DUF927 domain-containing protein, partial [Escherichia sp. R-CC3]
NHVREHLQKTIRQRIRPAGALLHDLKIDPFIVELAGSTSTGKTTALKVAASVWGTNQLVNEFNVTKGNYSKMLPFVQHLPLLH